LRSRSIGSMLSLYAAITLLAMFGAVHADSSRPLLVLYAFPEEGQAIAAKMTTDSTVRILGRVVHLGSLNGKVIVLAESGVGMTNAAMTAQEMIDHFRPRGIVFSGIAGAVDTSVHVGDLCVCSRWMTHDYVYCGPDSLQPQPLHSFSAKADSLVSFWNFPADSGYLAAVHLIDKNKLALQKIGVRQPRIIVGGAGVSGNAFIDNREKRLWLNQRFGALITDMESASVAQVSLANGTPFIIIRSASDLAGGSEGRTAADELDQFFRIAAGNSSSLVMALISLLD
jgi:adenosylhomocysteine nucleosidase